MDSHAFYVMVILKVIPASLHGLITTLCLVTDSSFDDILLAVAVTKTLRGASIVVLDFRTISSGKGTDRV